MIIKQLMFWLYLNVHSLISRISIALYNTEEEILKANAFDLKEGDKKIQRHRHKNKLLEKFYAGQTDERYVSDYYEVLKKADKFIRTATPHKMEVAAYKYGTSYGMEDEYSRKHEHYGFFDDKHKNAGKTLEEVLEAEAKSRRTDDDDYELITIYNNHPIEVGLAKAISMLKPKVENEEDVIMEINDIAVQSKQFEFPIKPIRNEGVTSINKIEQLTEYLHIKRIGFEYIQLEFFIPLKFKTNEIELDSELFKDITSINGVYINDDYGSSSWYGISKFTKRIINNSNTHEVWKFEGIEIEKVGKF